VARFVFCVLGACSAAHVENGQDVGGSMRLACE
jgi:hypothetical protein